MIVTSPDGQWAAVKRGREVTLLAGGAGPATARIELPSEAADLVIVGPPSVLVAVTRSEGGSGERCDRLTLYQPPYLDAAARLDFDTAMRIAGQTGPRLVLVSLDGKAVMIVRIAGRALSTHALDTGSPVEFAVGLERNQVLFGLLRKLEAWDAVSGRPLLRMQLPLPPPPRTVGPAHGHLWATRPGGDDILVCRLSDGRPFRHAIGVAIDDVIHHPASSLLVLVTARGLVRLHCLAHSLTVIDAPWQPGTMLAQLVAGDDISLLGLADGDDEPWRVPIGGTGAPGIAIESPEAPSEPVVSTGVEPAARSDSAADRADRAERGDRPDRAPARMPSITTAPRAAESRGRAWRDPLATFGAELVRGADAELPVVAADTELGRLAQRLSLPSGGRRALIALYSLYLVGEPGVAIARLAHALGDWTEALGQGELGALAMLRRRGGKVGLRRSVTDLLDGLAPRAIRVIGDAAAVPRPGAARLARDGRSDAAIESELATQLGRIAVIEGGAALALLEARLHGTTAVALAPPPARPLPWPRDAGLIVVAEPAAPAWVAALPALTAA